MVLEIFRYDKINKVTTMINNHKVGTNPLLICSLEFVRFTKISNINERCWKHINMIIILMLMHQILSISGLSCSRELMNFGCKVIVPEVM